MSSEGDSENEEIWLFISFKILISQQKNICRHILYWDWIIKIILIF